MLFASRITVGAMTIREFGWIADAARRLNTAEVAAEAAMGVESVRFSAVVEVITTKVERWTRRKVILTTKVTATVGRIGIRVYRLITSRTTITTPLNTKATSRTGIPTVITTDLINKIELAKEGAKAIVHYTEEGGRKVAHFIKHL
jgi:hypothetical protein